MVFSVESRRLLEATSTCWSCHGRGTCQSSWGHDCSGCGCQRTWGSFVDTYGWLVVWNHGILNDFPFSRDLSGYSGLVFVDIYGILKKLPEGITIIYHHQSPLSRLYPIIIPLMSLLTYFPTMWATMWGCPFDSVQLVNITTISLGFIIVITIVRWCYKPTYNVWAPHIVWDTTEI